MINKILISNFTYDYEENGYGLDMDMLTNYLELRWIISKEKWASDQEDFWT